MTGTYVKTLLILVTTLSLSAVTGACRSAAPVSAVEPGAEAQPEVTDTPPVMTESLYPAREVRVVVPFGLNGTADVILRGLADEMRAGFPSGLSVVNIAGANGATGTNDVYNAPKDGYNILGHNMLAFTGSRDDYKDWVAWDAVIAPYVLAVRANAPFQTMEDLLAAMKTHAGAAAAASAGADTSGKIGAHVLAKGARVTFEPIPYADVAAALSGCLAGEVDFVIQPATELVELLRSGALRALACFHDEDMVIAGLNGDVAIPSVKRAVPGAASMLPLGESFGMMVPDGIENSRIDVINAAYQQAVGSETFRLLAQSKGMVVLGYDTEETAAYLNRLAAVVNEALAE